ncbi:hypothetical protein DL95DRAFT_384313 [Leptodontidium sp. 2 PMI_412]|nr:hypothetical protein DL95DRAFT_384313 [Leptodontidium sp. 2 PMI_412]
MFDHVLASSSSSMLLLLLLPALSNCAVPAPPEITPPPLFRRATPDVKADPVNACWNSWSSYRSNSFATQMSSQYPGTTKVLSKYIETYFNQETVNYDNMKWTTLCDGHTREVSRAPTTTLATSYSTYFNYTTWIPERYHTTNVVPTCTYSRDSKQCTKLWSSWSSSTSAAATASDYPTTWDDLVQFRVPPCDQPEWDCPVKPDLAECTVGADYTGTMYYWPVTTVSGDFCAQNGTTLTPKPTKPGHPNTVVFHGETFTSPSVYLVYPSVTAYYRSAGQGLNVRTAPCGPTVTDVTLTMAPQSVSSVQYKVPDEPMSISWDDFNTVRREAWADSCPYPRACTGWVLGPFKNYNPFIQVPHELVKEGGRAWKNCTGWSYVRPKLVPLGPKMTTEGGWHHGVLGTVAPNAAKLTQVGAAVPMNTDSFPG